MKIKSEIGKIRYLGDGILNSYSQVFFSDKPVFALLILLITFLVPLSGLAGLTGICISLLLATWLGFDRLLIAKGIFSYNTLLVILPLGLYFEPGWPLVLIVLFASILTFFLAVAFRSIMSKSGLPFLSWPFVIGLWTVMLAVKQFSSIEVGDQSLFVWNRLYNLGGLPLVNSMEWMDSLRIPMAIKTYLTSMGAIFFQYNLIAGSLIAIGLIIYSRIAFLLSLIGFFSAYIFYSIVGMDINTLNYSYIGFNYILTAIAVGGFFLIPSVYTFLWTLILMPVVTLLTVSLEQLFAGSHLSIYALPFNMLVPLFLYVLRQRQGSPAGLHPVIVQHNSPEKNLYAWLNYRARLSSKTGMLFRLPVMGTWTVSQGHNGSLTHRSDWRFAWDFVKEAPDGRTFLGDGMKLTDYQCYGKPVFAAGDGFVDSVADGVPDNAPGDANTSQNWGNTVVIRHAAGLFSKYSHLRPGSIRVKEGNYVTSATELAQTGNSGRSPEPHLHFQFQSEPNINAATIEYPFGYYLLVNNGSRLLRSYDHPAENDRVSNLVPDNLLRKALHFIPGQKIAVHSGSTDPVGVSGAEWEVHTDYYNNSYIFDRIGKATAWFVNDGQLFYFTHYEGSVNNNLFIFFMACFRVPLVFDRNLIVTDQLPVLVSSTAWIRWLQDWIAPFYIFLRSGYTLKYADSDDILAPSVYRLNSQINHRVFNRSRNNIEFRMEISREGTIMINRGNDITLELKTLIR